MKITRLVFVALAVIAIPAAGWAQGVQVNYPLKKVGDSCSFKKVDDWNGSVVEEFTLEVTAVTAAGHDLIKKSKTAKAGEVSENVTETLDLNAVSWGVLTYSPDSEYYSFPLYVGKPWHVKASYTKVGGFRGSYELDAKVVGEENVGGLSTLKISYEGWYKSTAADGRSGQGTVRMTRWYAPSVGCTAKASYEDTDWGGRIYSRNTTYLTANSSK